MLFRSCRPVIFKALEQCSQENGDNTLSGAIQNLAKKNQARTVDIAGRFWIDVDDPAKGGNAVITEIAIGGQGCSISQASASMMSSAVKGKTIGEINEIATTVASAVEEQGAATQEIARTVQQAAQGTGEVSSNITSVTEAAAETGSAAKQVLDAAGQLSKDSETLKAEVEKFLAGIRAA